MKKLLAMILCVMMFVAVMPTSAFAAHNTVVSTAASGAELDGWADKYDSKTYIKDLKDDMAAMYYAIAADQTVFATAQTLHSLADGIATSMFEGVDDADHPVTGTKTYHDDLVDNTRAALKAIIGNEIYNYMNARVDLFTNAEGKVKPEAYLKTFADAASKAVTSEKAQKGIEAFAYGLAALKLQKSINDEAGDLQKAIKDWGESKWTEFGDGWNTWANVTADDPQLSWAPFMLTGTVSDTVVTDSALTGALAAFNS